MVVLTVILPETDRANVVTAALVKGTVATAWTAVRRDGAIRFGDIMPDHRTTFALAADARNWSFLPVGSVPGSGPLTWRPLSGRHKCRFRVESGQRSVQHTYVANPLTAIRDLTSEMSQASRAPLWSKGRYLGHFPGLSRG